MASKRRSNAADGPSVISDPFQAHVLSSKENRPQKKQKTLSTPYLDPFLQQQSSNPVLSPSNRASTSVQPQRQFLVPRSTDSDDDNARMSGVEDLIGGSLRRSRIHSPSRVRSHPKADSVSHVTSRSRSPSPAQRASSRSSRTPAPTIASSSTSVHEIRVPKAVSDKLRQQDSEIEQLKDDLASAESKINGLELNLEKADTEIQELSEQLAEHERRLEIQTNRFDELFELVQTMQESRAEEEDGEDAVVIVKKSKKPAVDKDSVVIPPGFATAVRKAFYVLMGMPADSKYKKVFDFIGGKMPEGGAWIDDPQSNGTLLRPGFLQSFADNSVWHDTAFLRIRQQIPKLVPVIKAADMKEVEDGVIHNQLSTVFRNMSREVRIAANKTGIVAGNAGAGGDDGAQEDGAVDSDVENRQDSRKYRKLDERNEAMDAAGWARVKAFEFLRQNAAYHSTDESQYSDVVDPNSEPENGGTAAAVVVKKRRSATQKWRRRPPTYRTEHLQGIFDAIETLVTQRRAQLKTDNRGRTQPHARELGPPKDVPLPYFRGNSMKKRPLIPLEHVNPDWLAAHPQFNTFSRIEFPVVAADSDDDGDGDGDSEGDA
ncbi:hypothetical protein MKEN_00310900 [Mycena kentingensis (nom. inval.)]|nr:hypothetical protein MKEN_00310900 [Mycena kentingensis (nom. inval.)]